MKIIIALLISYLPIAALAATEDVNAILANPKFESIDKKLSQKGYELASVTLIEGKNPHLTTTVYQVVFKRGDINQVNKIELPAYVTDRGGKKEVGIPDLIE